jgi:RHH-type proline utilization regulon transcriptional repressor/proline dehydrogenase/delta 1-pyrroline-5-carboxylate dehydrogenase
LLSGEYFSDEQKLEWQTSAGNYAFYWSHYFSKGHDSSHILGQDNILSYRPHKHLLLRLNNGDSSLDLWRAIAASVTVGGSLEISTEEALPVILNQLIGNQELHLKITTTIESEENLIERLPEGKIRQIRMFSVPSQKLQEAFSKVGCNVKIAPTLANGRIELLSYLREVSLSYNYHRYGNIGERELASGNIQ